MWRDLQVAVRTLGRQRSFAAVVVITLALGIGGSTAIFSVLNAVLLRELPYPDPSQLYLMRTVTPDGSPTGNITPRELRPFYEVDKHPTVEAAAIAWSQETQIVGTDGKPHPTTRYGVTDQFFEVFGSQMALGRGFTRGQGPGPIVISYSVWRAILLLIACINVTNLLLSRVTIRAREMAVREAVGAGRWRVVRQLLTESLLLSLLGGALGIAGAVAGIRLLLRIAPPDLPRLDTVPIDSTVLLFALGVTLLTGVLVGLVPAVRLARNQLRNLMNEGGRGASEGPARNRLFSVLVVTEIALAALLVIGAGYGVTSLDLRVFVLASLILFGVAAIACFVPARRATHIHPAELLRME